MDEPRPVLDPLEQYVARAEVAWEERDGTVLLAMPKPMGRLGQFLGRLLRAPEAVSVRLDAAGTATWLLADGTRTGEEIAQELGSRFGGDGWAHRARLFVESLAARDLLVLTPHPAPARDPLVGFPGVTGYRASACRNCGTTVRVKGPARARYQCPGCGRLTRAAP